MPWRISWTTPTEQYVVAAHVHSSLLLTPSISVVRKRGQAEDQERSRHHNGVEKASIPHGRPKGTDTGGGEHCARRRDHRTLDVLDNNIFVLRTGYRDLTHVIQRPQLQALVLFLLISRNFSILLSGLGHELSKVLFLALGNGFGFHFDDKGPTQVLDPTLDGFYCLLQSVYCGELKEDLSQFGLSH